MQSYNATDIAKGANSTIVTFDDTMTITADNVVITELTGQVVI